MKFNKLTLFTKRKVVITKRSKLKLSPSFHKVKKTLNKAIELQLLEKPQLDSVHRTGETTQ